MRYTETEHGLEVSLADYESASVLERQELRRRFILESNVIEGIYTDPVQTHFLIPGETLETSVWMQNPEAVGHREAFVYMMDFFRVSHCTRADILQMHEMVGRYLIKGAGHWRKGPVYVGIPHNGRMRYKGMAHARQLRRLMTALEGDIQALDAIDIDDATVWNVHHKFLVFHPFTDGNGRVARLLLNWQSLRHLGKLIIVEAEKKEAYYAMIEEFDEKFREARGDVRFYKDIWK